MKGYILQVIVINQSIIFAYVGESTKFRFYHAQKALKSLSSCCVQLKHTYVLLIIKLINKVH